MSEPGGPGRGVSTVIGAVLIFGIVVMAWTTYQAVAVPQQNQAAEFDHNQRVQGQMLELRDAVLRTGATGVSQSVTITVGAEYPHRTLAVNFAVTGGRVATTEPAGDGSNDVTFRNVTATRREVADYWNSSRRTLAFPTADVAYRPAYTRYDGAPDTILSAGAVFNQFDRTNLSVADQIIVDGNRITVVVIDGDLEKAASGQGATVSFETHGLSVAENTIAVRNAGGRINITVPSSVANASAWNRSGFRDEPNVHSVTADGEFVSVVLENATYSLRMMKVGVGRGGADPGKRYIVDVDLPPSTVLNGTDHGATVEVRDRFNNPVGNVTVDATATAGSYGSSDVTTASDGRATFEWTAPGSVAGREQVTLTFNISEAGSPDEKILERTITVVDRSSGDGGGGGTTGPAVSAVDTNRTTASDRRVARGTVLNLTATASDVGRGGTDIIDAEWWSNRTDPGGSAGSGAALGPVDGQFDAPEEDLVDASIDTSSWGSGWHNLSVRARDGEGNWGPERRYAINVTDGGGGGGGGGADPAGPNAYDDENRNGRYDDGEATYTNAEIADGFDDTSVDLVIPSDVGTIHNQNSDIVITTNSITASVDITSQNGNIELTANEYVDLRGRTVDSQNGRVEVTVDGALNVDNATIDAPNGGIELLARSISARNAEVSSRNRNVVLSARRNGGGELDATGATISAGNDDIQLESDGDLRLESGTLYSRNGDATADLGAGSATLYVDGATIDDRDGNLVYSPGGVTVDGSPASGSVSR